MRPDAEREFAAEGAGCRALPMLEYGWSAGGSPEGVAAMPKNRFEGIAVWFFRLNGFLMLENFILHDRGARTDFDVIGVRFPHRAEPARGHGSEPFRDYETLVGTHGLAQVIICECTESVRKLNTPQTDPDKYVLADGLAAIGVFPSDMNGRVASKLLADGQYVDACQVVRLCTIAGSDPPGVDFPQHMLKLTWREVLTFIHKRMVDYRRTKAQIDHWPEMGQQLYSTAEEYCGDIEGFIAHWMESTRTERSMQLRP